MSAARRAVEHPLTLWVGFVVVHFVLGALVLYWGIDYGFGDSGGVYPSWVDQGRSTGQWVGLQLPWVYPILALPPMMLGDVLGKGLAGNVWLAAVFFVDAIAFAFVTGFGRDRRAAALGWWWLAFLLALGPIGLTRIDTWATAAAIIGLLLAARNPRSAGVLLAVAAWIKVWPAALAAAAVVALRRRREVLVAALALSAVVIVVVLILGGGANLFSFITAQSGRGLQIESVIATPWEWWGLIDRGSVTVYFDLQLITYELHGPGVDVGAALATPLLAVAVGGVLVLGIVAARRGAPVSALLPVMALAFTLALIVANKVGSPQYAGWIAAPILLGLAVRLTGRGIRWRVPVIGGLVIAGSTQLLYPVFYDHLVSLGHLGVVLVTFRNALYVALLVWSVVQLVRLVRRPLAVDADHPADDEDWLPRIWPFGRGASLEN